MRWILSICLLMSCIVCNAAHDWHVHTLQLKDGLSSNNVRCMFKDSHGFMWFGTSNGLDRYDSSRIKSVNMGGVSINSITEVGDRIYIGTEQGLYIYDSSGETLVPFEVCTSYLVTISSPVTSLIASGDLLMVGTYGQGLFTYDTVSGTLVQNSIGIPYITDLIKADDGSIYLAEESTGVYDLSRRGDVKSHILSRRGVSCIVVSESKLYYVCRNEPEIIGYVSNGEMVEKRLTVSLNDLFCMSSGRILLSTDSGLYEMDGKSFSIKPFILTGHGEDLSQRSYGEAFLDEEGTLWVASRTCGAVMISEKNNFLRNFLLPGHHTFMRLSESAGNEILVITEGSDYRLSVKEDRVIEIAGKSEDSDEGQIVCPDRMGNTYVAVGQCVYFSTPFEKDKKYYTFGHKVEVLFCDRENCLWVGTSGKGLWRMKDGHFESFGISSVSGIASLIYSIEQDQEGCMWVCTDIGIVKIDPVTGAVQTIIASEEARSDNRFLYRASMRSSSGVMYFGRNEGILSFNPSGNLVNTVSPKVTINSISFRNGKASVNDLYRRTEVTLPYSCNSFTLSFSVHSYQEPLNNTCTWSMSSIDEQEVWSRENSATYSNLRPGKYTFTVKGKNNDGVESDQPAVLRIIITPPWWLSRLAFVIYTLMIVAAAACIYRLWKRRFDIKYSERLQKSKEVIEQEAYRQKINFFLGMVHEIRTPLTIMRLSLDNVISSKAEDKSSVKSLRDNLDYMQETVNGILTFHRKDSGDTALILSRTDVVQVCRTIIERFEDTAKLKKIDIEAELPVGPVFIMADESFLSKIIMNLLSNAFKYAVSRVKISISDDFGSAVVRVSDDGPGVKPAEKDRIFEMFYKAKGDRIAEASGLGVGLAYSRQLAADHDGTLVLDDSVQEGASFVLRVPLIKDKKEIVEEAGTDSLAVTGAEERLKVVVADDNVELVTNLERILSQWYSVRVAYNGEEALRLVEAEDTDIIVSDVMMPVMDGMELCRHIKERVEYSHIPFIMLTAKINVDDKREGMESGADAYVEKPFSISQIHHQIENLIRLRNSLREKVSNEVGRRALEMPKMQNARDAQFMSAINAAIEEQIRKDDFSIDALADAMCMSKANFYRKFKAITGTSPNEYMKTYRLNRAAEMIAEGARINEAAEAVGFDSSSYFAKCFKAKFGVLPNDYLKN